MATGEITAQSFSSRKVCIARAREHLANRAYKSARNTLERGLHQWTDLEFDHEYLTLLAHAAWRQQLYPEARRLLRAACQDEASHVEARFLLGRVLLESGRVEHAVGILSRIADDEEQLVPYRVHAGGALCVAYSALGLNKSSQDALEKAAAYGLISAQLLADEGFRLMRVGGYQQSEVQLAKALQIDTTCEDAFFRLANVLFITDKTEAAMEVLAYGIEQSPEMIPFYELMAELYVTRDHPRQAAAFLKRAIELSPRGATADVLRIGLAQYLHRAGRHPEALLGFRDVLVQHPRTPHRGTIRARIKALETEKKGARRRVLGGFPRKLQKRAYCAPNTLANVLEFVGRPATQEEVAARVFRGTGTRWPEVVDYLAETDGIATRAYIGSLSLIRRCVDNGLPLITTEYYGMSGHALAVIGYDDVGDLVIAQDPRFLAHVEIPYREFLTAWAHDDGFCIAVAPAAQSDKLPEHGELEAAVVGDLIELFRHRGEGRDEEAMKLAAEMSEKSPDRQVPLRVMAEIALERKALDELKGLCEEALKKWPDAFWARRHLGDALWMGGDTDGAREAYRRARKLDARDPTLTYALGELLLSIGERSRGRAHLIHTLFEDPGFRSARLRLAEDLFQEGDSKGAGYHARLLVEFDPDDREAKDLLARISGNTVVKTLAETSREAAKLVAANQDAQAASAKIGPDEDTEVEVDLDDL